MKVKQFPRLYKAKLNNDVTSFALNKDLHVLHNIVSMHLGLWRLHRMTNNMQDAKLMKEYDPEGKFRNAQAESWFDAMDNILSNSSALKQDENNVLLRW